VTQFLYPEEGLVVPCIARFQEAHMSKNDPPQRPEPGKGAAGAGTPGGTPEGGAEAYARWLEHMQRTRGRHAAITRNLYTWSNYKNWADKVRTSWDPDSGK
jgi:hypothetical protein